MPQSGQFIKKIIFLLVLKPEIQVKMLMSDKGLLFSLSCGGRREGEKTRYTREEQKTVKSNCINSLWR